MDIFENKFCLIKLIIKGKENKKETKLKVKIFLIQIFSVVYKYIQESNNRHRCMKIKGE